MENIKVLGVGGLARSGKDTFTEILINQLAKRGKKTKQVSLAGPLKQYCDEFCKTNLGISSFTQVPEEKILIRPLLVWFGDAKRKQTNGRFWINLATKAIQQAESDGFDVAIVSDVRYSFYERDEVYWLKNEMAGNIAHVSRYTQANDGIKEFLQPPNDHERINNPKVRAAADYVIEWPTLDVPVDKLTSDDRMIKYGVEFLNLVGL